MKLRLIWPLIVCAVGVTAESSAQEAPPRQADAFEYHALAMEAELDGNRDLAIEFLRKAFAEAPTDDLISFDLVRLLADDPNDAARAELQKLLEAEPKTLDASLLQVYLHLKLGATDEAKQKAEDAAEAFPDSTEARELSMRLNPELRATAPSPSARKKLPFFSARVLGGAQYDSNVLVVPDQPNPGAAAPASALRALVDGDLTLRLLQGDLASNFRAGFNAGPHLTDDVTITAYDAFSARSSVSLGGRSGNIEWQTQLRGDSLFIDREAFNPFLLGGTVSASVRYVMGAARVGVALRGGLRDFDEGNPEGLPNDRDGARSEAVLTASWGNSKWGVYGRAGYQGEHTDGVEQTENGIIGSVGTQITLSPVTLDAGINYELRNYVANTLGRVDQRITGSIGARVEMTKTLALTIRGAWTENMSDVSPTDAFLLAQADLAQEGVDSSLADQFEFSYTRQLATLGVEARW